MNVKIWGAFAIFMVFFMLVTFADLRIGDSATSTMWLLLAAFVTILSILMLIKNKLPGKKQIFISIAFGVALFFAYTLTFRMIIFSAVQVPLVTVLCSLAMFSVFSKYENNSIKQLKGMTIKTNCITIVIGTVVGIIWGIGNLFLNDATPNFVITPYVFIMALSPGIYEEIAFRAFVFAACLYFLNGELASKKQRFTCWFMMVVPHVLIHMPDMFIDNGLINGIIGIIMLTILFGLPFAFLQRKWDLTSAMIAHGIVIVIRFSAFGIPGLS